MDRIKGKVALVTGGTSGIGLAIAKRFIMEGAQVIVTGRDPGKLEEAEKALGANALAIVSDTKNLAGIDALMAEVKEKYGLINVLVCNAGVGYPLAFEQTSEEQFDDLMAINMKGTFFTIQKALPIFAENASIILITSITSRSAVVNYSAYSASKAAMCSLAQTLGVELVGTDRRIRVNAVAPGVIATEAFFNSKGDSAEMISAALSSRTPNKRLGSAEDVANVVLFLASDESSHIVGEEIVVDGGISLKWTPK